MHSSGNDLHILHGAVIYQLNAKLFVTDQQRLHQPAILDLEIIRKSERTSDLLREAWLKCPRLFAVQQFDVKPFAALPMVARTQRVLLCFGEPNTQCSGQIELDVNSRFSS